MSDKLITICYTRPWEQFFFKYHASKTAFLSVRRRGNIRSHLIFYPTFHSLMRRVSNSRFARISGHLYNFTTSCTVLLLDGNSEYVAHAWTKIDLFWKKIQFVTALELLIIASNRSNNINCSLRALLFLSYPIIWKPCSPGYKKVFIRPCIYILFVRKVLTSFIKLCYYKTGQDLLDIHYAIYTLTA